MQLQMKAIGSVASPRKTPEDDHWGAVESVITLSPEIPAEALQGLDQFSHVEVVFFMHLVPPGKIETGARHPRQNLSWPKVGIFAQRAKSRPNQIGVTLCEVQRVEGSRLYVRGLDAVDGTPVLDIKPYMKEFGPRGALKQPAWATELMMAYFS